MGIFLSKSSFVRAKISAFAAAMAVLLLHAPAARAINPPAAQYGPSSFVNFETPHVHPMDETPDGKNLLAVNTAEGSLMIFSLTGGSPTASNIVMVGVDPVSVRARTATEVWVVNRVSGSISIINLALQQPMVVATLDVCHEPGDVVFAGSPQKAVVSCTRPNQLVTIDPVGRTIIAAHPVAGESPRALAVSTDGSTVYAAIFESGTPTTILVGDTNDARINNVTQNPAGPWGGISPVPNNGAVFNPPMNPANPPPPPVSTIVYKTGDGYFTNSVACSAAIFGSPVVATGRSCYAQNPSSLVWSVCAQEGGTCTFKGRQRVMFGAAGYYSTGKWKDDVNGDWTELVTGNLSYMSNRVANWDLVDRDVAMFNVSTGNITYQTRLMNAVMAISVNPGNSHIYAVGTDATNSIRFQPILDGVFLRVNVVDFLPGQAPSIVDLNPQLNYTTSSVPVATRNLALGDPRGIAWTSNGKQGFITGMGSNNVVVINSSGARVGLVNVGQGPTGVVVDNARGQAYILNKFDGTISVIGISSLSVTSTIPFFDPTPSAITSGRQFLYNTHIGSGTGHISCASCHIDGKTDRLAWDLGDPSAAMSSNGFTFHPMKGPFVTQTLQNIIGSPDLHHRGDRADIFAFAPAYQELQGAAEPLDNASMTQLQSFLATLAFPPNPNRNADNSLSTAVALPGPLGTVRAYADATVGSQEFNAAGSCVICHIGSMGRDITQGPNSLHLSQDAAPETMQGLYQRLGMYWQSATGSTVGTGVRPTGASDSTFANESTTNEMLAYMLSFEGPQDSIPQASANTHAGVGLQLTLTAAGATQQYGTFCANLNGTCTFTGTREVIFGTNGVYQSGVFTGSAPCNTATFGNPVPGAVETCAVRGAPLTLCAAENGYCAVGPLSEVFFSSGSGPANSLVFRNAINCTAAIFGNPGSGSVRNCYYRPASEFAKLNYMISIAETGKVGLVANGYVYGQYRGGYYIGGGQFQTDILTDTAYVSDLYTAVLLGGSNIQLVLVPRGSEYRIGVDANLDGILNTDQTNSGHNPRSTTPGTWQNCAADSSTCRFPGLSVVRYGVPGQYAYGVFNGGVSCSKTVFGDPAPGQTKSCSTPTTPN